MRNMRSMPSSISGPYNGTYSRAPRNLYLSHIHCLPSPPDTDESSWLPSQFGRYNGETLLHSGEKLRLEKNPNEVHARDQSTPGGGSRSTVQQVLAGTSKPVREIAKRIPELVTGREAQPRKDAVIGASATRVRPWWRGAIDSRRRASRVISTFLPRPCTCSIFKWSREKNNRTRPENRRWCTRLLGSPWDHLRNVDVVYAPSPWRTFEMDGRMVENWAVGGQTLVIDLEGFAGNGQGDKFSDSRYLQSLRLGEAEALSEVVTPTDEG